MVISDIIQKTMIEVNEAGAEAAAVTAIPGKGPALQPEPPPPLHVVIDKPFLFSLRDDDRGLILLAGYVGEPKSE